MGSAALKRVLLVEESIIELFKQNNLNPEEAIKNYIAIFDRKQAASVPPTSKSPLDS